MVALSDVTLLRLANLSAFILLDSVALFVFALLDYMLLLTRNCELLT